MCTTPNAASSGRFISALYPTAKDPQRPSKYEAHLAELVFTGIEFPEKVSDSNKFERQNPIFALNVYWWDNCIHSLHIATQEQDRNIDLLLLINETDKL